MVESLNKLGVNEVDECIANIAGVVIVNGQIKEVELHLEMSVQLF